MPLSRFYEADFIEDKRKVTNLVKVRHQRVLGQETELGLGGDTLSSSHVLFLILVPLDYFRQRYGFCQQNAKGHVTSGHLWCVTMDLDSSTSSKVGSQLH